MDLGAFSVSLSVSDLSASAEFYATLGFESMGGDAEQGWLILRNANGVTIGLFHGMFEGNILTFNPGWDQNADEVDGFTDVREIEDALVAAGIELNEGVNPDSPEGPGSIMLVDPDGNTILIDQHR